MKIHWHTIRFDCSCGLPATVLEVAISMDGGIIFNGLCVTCGKEVTLEDTLSLLLAKCAIQEFIECKKEKPQEFLLEDFNPKGKPS